MQCQMLQMPFAICHLPFGSLPCHLPFAICHFASSHLLPMPFAICHLPMPFGYMPYAICHLSMPFAIWNGRLANGKWQMAGCQMANGTWQTANGIGIWQNGISKYANISFASCWIHLLPMPFAICRQYIICHLLKPFAANAIWLFAIFHLPMPFGYSYMPYAICHLSRPFAICQGHLPFEMAQFKWQINSNGKWQTVPFQNLTLHGTFQKVQFVHFKVKWWSINVKVRR